MLRQQVETAFATRSREEWLTAFSEVDACVEPVLSLADAAAHPHNRARGYITSLDGVRQPGPAPRFDRTAGLGARRVPVPGEHTGAVLHSLGLDKARIAALRAPGVAGGP